MRGLRQLPVILLLYHCQLYEISQGGCSVTEDSSEGKEKPGPGLPEKKNLMIAGIIVTVLIIIVIAVVFIQLPPGSKNAKPAAIMNITPKITKTFLPSGTRVIGQTPAIQITPAVPVDFILKSGNPSSCGLTCRQLDASITNTGYATAHDVCIDVSMHNSRNEIINLNGNPTLNRCIGDIEGGQIKTESITINADCGLFATKCIGETLTLQTRVTSVEKTVQFPDQLIAV